VGITLFLGQFQPLAVAVEIIVLGQMLPQQKAVVLVLVKVITLFQVDKLGLMYLVKAIRVVLHLDMLVLTLLVAVVVQELLV
jgi:hypothetical protein